VEHSDGKCRILLGNDVWNKQDLGVELRHILVRVNVD